MLITTRFDLPPERLSIKDILVCVPGGSYEDLTVESGTQNMYRKDLLVAEFARGGGSTADAHVFRVVKGVPAASASAASDPVLTQDNLASGGNKRQKPFIEST